MFLPPSFTRRFTVDASTGCWVWTGAMYPSGYGAFYWAGRTGRAHRFAYEACVGEIASEKVIDHLCRNRACVNPAHLEAVTPGENVRRGLSVGAKWARGERNGHSKISDVGVACLRTIRAAGFGSQTELAEMFGIGQPEVSRILRGKRRAAPAEVKHA